MRTLLCYFLTLACSYGYQHFEARQRHPVDLTPDGSLLLALNSPASTLCVFDAGNPARTTPLLIGEMPVGTEPVTVRARTNDEVWVVNEVSDSISVISLSQGIIIDTLRVSDEPADVCFAAGKAFVSCARNRRVMVFDAVQRTQLGQIEIDGLYPRALVANANGSKIYVASLLSGSGTTILKEQSAPAQPAPTNTSLPAAPKTALIVPATDSRISWTTLDHDIAEIDTGTLAINRWFAGVGTHLFDLALHPDGSVWCANSDSLNLTRFEPQLRGQFSRHRLTRLVPSTASIVHHDLNPDIARAIIPAPASIALSLAQPTAMVFNSDGSRVWTSAFNSDRVAEIDEVSGAVLRRVDLRIPAADSRSMRGPRGLALSADGARLFVLNKISDTISTVDIGSGTVLSEIPIGSINVMPPAIRQGRGFLYDARLSGNGTMSCATCHLDADTDGLAWDLGDPGGEMVLVPSADLSIHDNTVFNRSLHPMKGPMVTQTLRGMAANDSILDFPAAAVVTKFHWRGDKPSIQSFNSVYPNLMGGSPVPAEDMDRLANYLLGIANHPNPNRNPDRSLRMEVNGADPDAGRILFNDHLKSHCIVCHQYNAGTDQNIDISSEVDRRQSIKNPPLRLVYQKAGIFNPAAGKTSLSGFGLGSDGSRDLLPKVHPYSLDKLKTAKDLANLTAFLLSFDTATAPAVGYDFTVTSGRATSPQTSADLALLESRAGTGEAGFVATGRVAGQRRSFRWDVVSQRYVPDRAGDPVLTRNQLLALLTPSDALTFFGVVADRARQLGGDRDADGILDQDEVPPILFIAPQASTLRLRWPRAADWFPETSATLTGPWAPWPGAIDDTGPETQADLPAPLDPVRFFRLQRTW